MRPLLTPDVEMGVGGSDDGMARRIDVTGVVALVVEVYVSDGERPLTLVYLEAWMGHLRRRDKNIQLSVL